MKKEMTIRAAIPADVGAIYAIWLEGIEKSFAGFAHPSDLREQFHHNFAACRAPFGFWVAEGAGQLLGWQSLLPCTSNPLKRNMLAEASTYVTAADRSTGVGHALLQRAQAEASAHGLRFILAYTMTANTRVGQLYQRCGFQPSGRLTTSEPDTFYAERLLWFYAVPLVWSAPPQPLFATAL